MPQPAVRYYPLNEVYGAYYEPENPAPESTNPSSDAPQDYSQQQWMGPSMRNLAQSDRFAVMNGGGVRQQLGSMFGGSSDRNAVMNFTNGPITLSTAEFALLCFLSGAGAALTLLLILGRWRVRD